MDEKERGRHECEISLIHCLARIAVWRSSNEGTSSTTAMSASLAAGCFDEDPSGSMLIVLLRPNLITMLIWAHMWFRWRGKKGFLDCSTICERRTNPQAWGSSSGQASLERRGCQGCSAKSRGMLPIVPEQLPEQRFQGILFVHFRLLSR